MTIDVGPSPDDRVYVEFETSGVPRDITSICLAWTAMERYEDMQQATVDLLRNTLTQCGSTVSTMTVSWPARWTGLTPLGIEQRGPTWEDAEWLG